ncbi:cytosolic phospholipase A2 zeta-like isoform X1 [Ictalurus furcatus]|uniref:cytosolic phospholipase A2 zeta-like isoform X1 n=2 Tax=Ictalurus furcatus TaxID=66913 RepID=UPI0023507F9D|nr:cytosolic phospholipase A2 zeta-like isoform X1 [Ictalurus furcatus]
MKKELAPRWNLSVTVLRGKIEHSYDYFSQPDLYVTLRLPTASACTLRTRTINNSGTPEWNETFHFRTFSQAKNVLEINLYDKDIMRDDECTGILFDVSTLKLGQKETKVFITDDKKKDKLWVEFEITESPEAPVQYLTNGVLLAAPLSTLEVKLDKIPTGVRREMLLKLQGAYKEDQVISMSKNISLMQTLRYYINKNLETEIELRMDKGSPVVAPVTQFGPNTTLSLPVAKETVNLHLNTVDSSEEDMKVRLDFDIPAEEKAFLVKRKQVVSCALQTFLNLKTPLDPNQVPTVAVVCSGGSSRAMTGMYGSMKGLKSLGLLDAISYITSVSGSTWATASLYSDPLWSKGGLDKVIASAQKELSKSTASLFSLTQLHYYRSELQNREKEGHSVSFIDTWGLVIEQLIFGKKHTGTLSDQKKAVSEGQNPLPIYTAVNMKKDASGSLAPVTEWCEFTPYEVGFSKYGAFVPAETFGSEFYLGHVIKKSLETRISFLLGMWSSVFSANLLQLWCTYTGKIPSWASQLGDKVDSIETDKNASTLDTLRVSPGASVLCSFLNDCPIISTVFNFLRGFSLHNLYRKSPGFNTFNETHLDAFPNQLTPADSTLSLVDPGFAINMAFSPVLRPHRRADVILSLDYSWVEDRLQTLKETQQYCSEHKLPFPNIDFSKYKSEPNREVYVFEDEKNPDAPIVIHFPLVNISFKEYKEPGVKRRGKKELDEGNIDVSSNSSPYNTMNITFQSEDVQRLVDLASYNIVNNREIVQNALKKALNKKSLC